jgi:phage baseplate assembly protein V
MTADYTLADLYRRVSRMVMRGVVHSVQASPPRCRVTFGTDPLTGDVHVSDWLLWYAWSDSELQTWSMPAVGAPAVVMSEGGDTRNGIVFPGRITDDQTPAGASPNEHVTRYSDGAQVSYDSAAHAMAVTLPDGGSVKVIAAGGIKLQGDTEIDGSLTVKGDAVITGNVSADGDISDKHGTVQAIRVTYNGHKHKENGDGGGETDPPDPQLDD